MNVPAALAPWGIIGYVDAVRAVGVLVRMASRQRPAASVVLLEGTWSAPTVTESQDLTSGSDDLATQLSDLARALRSFLSGAQADCLVIRRADFQRQSASKEGPRLRLLAEGALAASAHEQLETVVVKTGKELADLSPAANKDALDLHAGSVAPSGVSVQAVAAALVGLPPV